MEKYSKAVSEMYSQFNQREVHPLGEYIGRLAYSFSFGRKLEIIGYSRNALTHEPLLIVDASQNDGWSTLEPFDVIFKECERYWYVSVDVLVD